MGFWEAQELAHRDRQEAFEREAIFEVTKILVGRMDEMIDALGHLTSIYMEVRVLNDGIKRIETELREMKGVEL